MGPQAAGNPSSRRTVMASIDRSGHDDRFVIADVDRDDAWVSISSDQALLLSAYR